jgi:TonB family protein
MRKPWVWGAALVAVGASVACATARTQPVQPVDIPVSQPATAVAVLLQNLSSPDARLRSAAAWELAGADSLSREATAAVRQLVHDPERSVRYAAAWALGHFESAEEASNAVLSSTPPKPIRQTKPRYPQGAFDTKLEGTVLVEILIGEQGEVAHAEVRKSIPEFDEAALACVRQWQFEPALSGGVPRATLAHVPVTFRIY